MTAALRDFASRIMPRGLGLRFATRQKVLFGATAASVGCILLIRVVYLPVVGLIRGRWVTLQDLRVKTADAQVVTEHLVDQERAVKDATQQYRALERRLSDAQTVARILEVLAQQAKGHRLELVALQPREEESAAPRMVRFGSLMRLQEIPLTLTLTGRYRQLGEFMGELIHAPFLSSVEELKIAKAEPTSPRLRAQMTLVVFLAEGRAP